MQFFAFASTRQKHFDKMVFIFDKMVNVCSFIIPFFLC